MTELLLVASLWLNRLEPVYRISEDIAPFLRTAAWQAYTSLPETGTISLQNNDRLENLSAPLHAIHRFVLDVPPNTARLEVRLRGGSGDADLYVRAHDKPDLRAFDHRPFVSGNHETVRIDKPAPGLWHLMLHAFRPFEGVTLSVICHPGERDPTGDSVLSTPDLELSLYYELSGMMTPDGETWSRELRNQVLRDEGRQAFTNGEYDRAIRFWTKWREQDPANPDPVYLIGDTYLRMGEPARAVDYYQQSLEIQPGQITLMIRLARLIDQHLDNPKEARNLLNRYSRLFPYHPNVALAQAEWLLRRRRFDEADRIVKAVIEAVPDHLQARTLLHGLLRDTTERFENLQAMLAVGESPGMHWTLAQAMQDHQLMTRPESWILLDFVDRMRIESPSRSQRELFASLMPRNKPASENFRLGRMSRSWVSSREQQWNEEGHLILSADPQQTEAYLRLDRSEAMQNGFVEATIEATRGFFWLYARRGEGNMIRFGFDESGMMYQQIWINGNLQSNQMRLWSRPEGPTTLRLEIRADGAFSLIDGRPAFSSPLTIPRDMGLGWWGIAPWSPDFGRAAVTIRSVAGGPLPALIGLMAPPRPAIGFPSGSRHAAKTRHTSYHRLPRTEPELEQLQAEIQTLSMLAPGGYRVDWTGTPYRENQNEDIELRLLARFYRVRLMPQLHYPTLERVPWSELTELARRDRLDGFTLLLPKMPDPAALGMLKKQVFQTGLDFVLIVREPDPGHVLIQEVKAGVGILPGPRRPVRLPVIRFDNPDDPPVPPQAADSAILLL